MWDYTEKVKAYFENPQNIGEVENPDGVGEVGLPGLRRCLEALL